MLKKHFCDFGVKHEFLKHKKAIAIREKKKINQAILELRTFVYQKILLTE